MPQRITRKCQQVADYINNHQDDGAFREREFSNTTVRIYEDWDWRIFLFGNLIMSFRRDRNEYEVSNCGWRSRTTSHDIRAYLELLLNYAFHDWDIYTDSWKVIPPEEYKIECHRGVKHGRRWTFHPTALIFNWVE